MYTANAMMASTTKMTIKIPMSEIYPRRQWVSLTFWWQFRFREGNNYVLARSDGPWILTEGDAAEPDVVVTTTVDAWFRFVTDTPNEQTARTSGVEIQGTARAKRTFLGDLAVFTPAVGEAS